VKINMKSKILASISGLLVSLITPLAILVPQASAAPDTCIWVGVAGDYLFSNAANWTGCDGSGIPEDGDTIEFQEWVGPYNGEASNVVLLTNDIPDLEVAGLVSTGGTVVEEYFTPNHLYMIDVLGLVDGGTLFVDSDETDTAGVRIAQLNAIGNNIILDGVRVTNVVANQVTSVNGGNALNPSVAELIVSNGSFAQAQVNSEGFTYSDAQSIIIENGGQLTICGTSGDAVFRNDITLGGGSGNDPIIELNSCKGGGSPEAIVATPTFAKIIFEGKIVLNSDAIINSQNVQAQVNGILEANGNTLTLNAGNSRIKGFGNVGTVVLGDNSIISPGSSPGCISSTGITFDTGSTYDFEIAGNTVCTEYDQIDVTGLVTINGGVLEASFLGSFVPALNDEFIIISNDGTDEVTGEFDGLADGSRFEVAGVTFEINYDGGDGNDVVLTAIAVPASVAAPDTGIGEVLQNPIVALLATLLSIGAIVGIRKTQLAK
jgi:hypothetical protein